MAVKRKTYKKRTILTDKEQSALDTYINNPKISQTEAVVRSRYNPKNRHNASSIASRLFNKPEALSYLDAAASQAEQVIIKLMQSTNEKIALEAAKDVLDRTKGKATQKTITEQKTVTITADFTGGDSGGNETGDQTATAPEAATVIDATPEA